MKEVLPITIKLLREQESRNRQSKLEQLQAAGKEGDDGDADDSEFFHLAHSKAQVFENLEKNASEILSEASPLEPPKQNRIIEMGHMIKVRLIDDPDVKELGVINETVIHLLSTADVKALSGVVLKDKRFADGISQLIISVESPLGKAILGRKRGVVVIYQAGENKYRAEVLQSEDAIENTFFFDGLGNIPND